MQTDTETRNHAQTENRDGELAGEAAAALLKELPFSSMAIQVSVEGGWLTLMGELDWDYQCSRAERVAQNCQGVAGVSNLIARAGRLKPGDLPKAYTETSAAQSGRAESEVPANGTMRSWAQRQVDP